MQVLIFIIKLFFYSTYFRLLSEKIKINSLEIKNNFCYKLTKNLNF